MKRPKQVMVNGQKYKIKYDNTDPLAYGETFSELNLISLRDNMATDKLIGILAHEITHAAIDESIFMDRRRFTEEEVCDIVRHNFLPMLRSNPEITAFLLQEIEDEEIHPTVHQQ